MLRIVVDCVEDQAVGGMTGIRFVAAFDIAEIEIMSLLFRKGTVVDAVEREHGLPWLHITQRIDPLQLLLMLYATACHKHT